MRRTEQRQRPLDGHSPHRHSCRQLPMGAPPPLLGSPTEPGLDRVEMDVADGSMEVAVRPNRTGPESRSEYATVALVTVVEALRVLAVEELHTLGQVRVLEFDQQVVVVAHQAERQA